MAKRGDPIDGVMLFDKPEGMSSNAALQKVRRAINAQKAGHTGTLDPFASGLLPLCFGNATKFSQDLLNADKSYVARVRLGYCSSTGDTEGEIEPHPAGLNGVTLEAIREAAQKFVGDIEQTPPMFSALKRDGRPLYEYAREGVSLAIEPRQVRVESLTILDFDGESFTMACQVSKGTYIRVLGEDIGRALGTAAYLTALRRTQVGDLTLKGAVRLDQLEDQPNDVCRSFLLGADRLLQSFPAVTLTDDEAERFMHGQRLRLSHSIRGRVRVYGKPWGLLGTALLDEVGTMHPERLIAH